MRSQRVIKSALIMGCLMAAACLSDRSVAASLGAELPKDGWVSWDVPAVDNAPAWCCFSDWRRDDPRAGRCELDGKSYGFGSRNRETTNTVRVYARLSNGKVERLRAMAPTCEAVADSPIHHLGVSDPDSSATWLREVVRTTTPTERESGRHAYGTDRHAFAALALHRGDAALNMLADEARGGTARERRREAVFWLGQTRGERGVDVLQPLMATDPDANIREHAAFSVSQSKSPRTSALLVLQGETDTDTKVRSQAWFWLAQTKAPDAERAISAAVRRDPERKVRHQAVFALSQLPDDRGVKALTAIAENRELDRDARKQAVFWLGQSKAPEAMAYLERTLLGTGK